VTERGGGVGDRKITCLPSDRDFGRLCVVLVATRNPLNLGAAARAMSNFGFARLRVVNPYEVAFREARSAVGAAELLKNAEEYGSVAEAVADCSLVVGTTAVRNRELQHRMHALPEGARMIRQRLRSGEVALLFGSEKTGLSNEALSHCHWLLRIPTREEHPSMNLGQAAALCLYEIARSAPRGIRSAKSKGASAGSLERITQELLEALRVSGYLKAERSAVSEAKVRRMVRRLGLQAEDAEVLLGMLKQMLWKMRTSESRS
jgi:TrmH family RNA methyltransferase